MKMRPDIVCVKPGDGVWPLHDTQATRRAEQAAMATLPAHALMERAGLSVAKLALALAPHSSGIDIWCGPGNNGGDGLVAATHLHQAGRRVRVALLGAADHLPADAAQALRQAQHSGVSIVQGLPSWEVDGYALAIDALLGLGSRRALEGDMAAAVNAINRSEQTVLAVDLPTGLNTDTGALNGDLAVIAHHTLALLTLKPGCHTAMGRDHAGQVWLDTLGVGAGAPVAWLAAPQGEPPRAHASHKGRHGDVVVVGGGTGMTGAAWLAARAALAAGCGRVICSPLSSHKGEFPWDTQRPELMTRDRWWQSLPQQLGEATVVCGCGGGTAVMQALPPLLTHVPRLAIDADALNAIARDEDLARRLRARAERGWSTVLTPHPLEAARLLQSTTAAIQGDRLAAAQQLAERYAATVVLKGSGSVIAQPGQVPRINSNGNGALSTAGTGDVLAGYIGGQWAQRPQADPAAVAATAVAQHGAAADRWIESGHVGPLRASDLIEALARR